MYTLYFKRKQAKFESRILTSEEKLRYINIEEMKVCYGTSIISKFCIEKAELLLKSNQVKGFEIKDTIIQDNCMYIKIKYSIPYNSEKNEYGTCFSVNYNENNKNIIVYGFNTFIANEKEVFNSIAAEIMNELSK